MPINKPYKAVSHTIDYNFVTVAKGQRRVKIKPNKIYSKDFNEERKLDNSLVISSKG
jgi:hypothetical protein